MEEADPAMITHDKMIEDFSAPTEWKHVAAMFIPKFMMQQMAVCENDRKVVARKVRPMGNGNLCEADGFPMC